MTSSTALENTVWTGARLDSWWTGKPPVFGVCPGMSAEGRIHSLPQLLLTSPTRRGFLDYFDNGWTLTEVLFSALQGEEAFTRPPVHGLRHPMIFYYAHVAVLYVNKLRLAGLITGPVNEAFEQYFEVGVDEMSWDDLSKNERTWPSVESVLTYRRQVYQAVRTLIETHPALEASKAHFLQNSPVWALALSLEHERIHLETSSVLIRELPLAFVRKPEAWPSDFVSNANTAAAAAPPKWCSVPAGMAHLGKPRNEPSFGWDNEYGDRTVEVPGFEVSACLISNGAFHEFVSAGGYREIRYWSEPGWKWKLFRNVKWPSFWVPNGPSAVSGFGLRRLFDVVPLDFTLPAIVNFYEAQAYGRWRAEADGAAVPYRLTTEVEQVRLRQQAGATTAANANLLYGSESPVTAHRNNGIGDAFGNVWQWCEDQANPLEGFSPHPYYEDFSTPCFDGKHQMILGGSFISTGDEAGPRARFHFRPHFHQHAGFRLVKDLGGPTQAAKIEEAWEQRTARYESAATTAQYLELHYGEKDEALPFALGPREALGFPRRVAEVILETVKKLGIPSGRALDLGCAVGGATFELARGFEAVVGVDLSRALIQEAQRLKDGNSATYERAIEGRVRETRHVVVDPSIDRSRVSFVEADAMNLPDTLTNFDAVLMANLLCRLPNPRKVLAQMSGPQGIVKRGGLLILASPYSWMSEFTPEEQWIGGALREGSALRGQDALDGILNPEFELLQEADSPCLIREHARKYQYIVSHLTVWRRR